MSEENAAMPETPTPPHILSAVMAVMQNVTNVPKTGKMEDNRGKIQYRFLKSADLVAEVGHAFREQAVMIQTERCRAEYTENSVARQTGTTLWTSARVEVVYLFTSLVDGSVLRFAVAGEGRDSSDKATAKAMTMALKTALSQAFMIATQDLDPDAERPTVAGERPAEPERTERQETEAQRQARLAYEARKRGGTPESRPAPAQSGPAENDPLETATQMLEQEMNAQREGGTGSPEGLASRALAQALKAVTQAEGNGTLESMRPKDQAQFDRCKAAIAAAQSAGDREQVNKIILHADTEGLLTVTIDGSSVGMMLSAARNLLVNPR